MSTNSQIITAALRALRIVGEGESASAAQSADALAILNQMLEAWSVEGIDLQYFAQTDVSAACPIPAWSERGVIACLALELAADYGAELTAAVAKRADEGYQTIARECLNARLQPADMSHLGGGQGRYNILTDT